jgi:nitroreductase
MTAGEQDLGGPEGQRSTPTAPTGGRQGDYSIGEDAPILEVLATMRAMRRLKPDPVPDELLEKLVEAATWAPSGSNLQAFEFVVVTDRAVMAELGELWSKSVDLYLKTVGEVTPAAQDAGARSALLFQRDHFAETPAVIVACYRGTRADPRLLGGFAKAMAPADFARLLPRLQRMALLGEASSVYPGVENLLLAARALGLGAVITVWHLFYEHEWKRVLGIPKNVQPYAVVPVGWPRGRFGPVTRRPAREVIHRDRW